MKKMIENQRKEMICPICEKEHFVLIKERKSEVLIKDEVVAYEEQYYQCENSFDGDNEFVSAEMMDINLLHARDAYRQMKGLLTSREIKKLREKYSLTQSELAGLLGWGEVTITRYESKLIQDETYDSILRMTWENPLFALQSLEKHQHKFREDRYLEIRSHFLDQLETSGMSYLKLQSLKGHYSRYTEANDQNGNQLLDLPKLSELIAYFAQHIGSLYKVKLMKLLWYCDVVSYKRNGKAMSGLVYLHKPFGALPLGYDELIYLPSVKVKEELLNWELCYRILPAKPRQKFHFTEEEKDILHLVLDKFKSFNAREIVEYMHEEAAYQSTPPDQIIPFSLAQNLNELH